MHSKQETCSNASGWYNANLKAKARMRQEQALILLQGSWDHNGVRCVQTISFNDLINELWSNERSCFKFYYTLLLAYCIVKVNRQTYAQFYPHACEVGNLFYNTVHITSSTFIDFFLSSSNTLFIRDNCISLRLNKRDTHTLDRSIIINLYIYKHAHLHDQFCSLLSLFRCTYSL
jgi:hypothetical protein